MGFFKVTVKDDTIRFQADDISLAELLAIHRELERYITKLVEEAGGKVEVITCACTDIHLN